MSDFGLHHPVNLLLFFFFFACRFKFKCFFNEREDGKIIGEKKKKKKKKRKRQSPCLLKVRRSRALSVSKVNGSLNALECHNKSSHQLQVQLPSKTPHLIGLLRFNLYRPCLRSGQQGDGDDEFCIPIV
jgi:hypothetical protein